MNSSMSAFEPQIRQILSAPGTDLTTISAKRVRRQLLELEPTLTAEYLRDNKEEVDAVIASVFEKVSADQGIGGSQEPEDSAMEEPPRPRKRKQEDDEDEEEQEGNEDDEDDEVTPPPKKPKKAAKGGRELSDAELARQLSSEINARSRRSSGKGRGSSNGSTTKKGGTNRKKKSAATIDSDDDSEDDGGKKIKPKKKVTGGAAKGGFAKEYALSEPLAAVLKIEKLSRPQVVKQLWEYIKGNELQNPSNKREIMCDESLRAVFNVDKIDMFKMNKVLGQHLHENEG